MRNKIIIIFALFTIVFGSSALALAQTPQPLSPPEPGQIVQDFRGANMVYVPSGQVMMGITREEAEIFHDNIDIPIEGSLPQYEGFGYFETYMVDVAGFWMDQYEVTIEQFQPFCDRFGCQSLQEVFYDRPDLYQDNQQPRVLVSWYEAQQFCEWRLARLPTEVEWEYAASGSEGFFYPWGTFGMLSVLGLKQVHM